MGDTLNDCLLSVNSTDLMNAMGYCKRFWSYKLKKSGVRYEVGLCIKTGDICWWNGPYEPGVWGNGMIFANSLKSHLELRERCKTDVGYLGSAPEFVKCPGGVWGESWKRTMQQRVRSRQETVNERLKKWAILSTPYHHNLHLHQTVFAAVITLFSYPLIKILCFWWNIMIK